MVLGDLDSYMQKNETQSSTYAIHKNKFKVDKRLKCKSQQHKSPRGKHRGETQIFHAAIFSPICPLEQRT